MRRASPAPGSRFAAYTIALAVLVLAMSGPAVPLIGRANTTGINQDAAQRREPQDRNQRRRRRVPSQLQWLGPDGIAGRIRSVVIHPTNDRIIYAGAATGGIWKTTNGGNSWSSLDDFMPTQVIGSLAMDPNDPNTIYAGTGEIHTFLAEGLWLRGQDRGQGIFVSRDGGATWRALAFTQTPTEDWRFVSRIAIDPSSPSHIFAATSTGLWQSVDGGQKFQRVLPGIFLDVKFHPINPRNVVASIFGGFTVFSNNFGANWTASVPPAGLDFADSRIELAPVTQTPSSWRALVIDRSASRVIDLVDSSDGGQTFTSLGGPAGDCGQTNRAYTGGLWVDPRSAQRMLVGGTFLCKTTDGGASYTQISAPQGVDFVDLHEIVAQPGSSDRILVGHDQGLKRILDFETAQPTVENLNNGLRTTQFHSAVADPVTDNVIGGTQDTGTLLRRDGSWVKVIGGDGIMVSRSDDIFYGGNSLGRVTRMLRDGSSRFCFSGSGSPPLAEAHGDARCGTVLPEPNPDRFCGNKTPILIDPNAIHRLYVGCRRLWRTSNARAVSASSINWSAVALDAAQAGPGNFVINAMDISGSTLMWLGTMRIGGASDTNPMAGGQLWKSTNAAAAAPTFDRMDDGMGLPNRPVFDVAIDPRNNQKVYLSYSGFAGDNVWKTTDGGASFTNISAGLPAVPVWSLAVHPTQAGWLYAGTDIGLYTSTDDGATWSATTRGPSTVAISDLQWKGDTTFLTVATYGRGTHELDARPNPELLFPERLTRAAGLFSSGHVENLIASDDKRFVFTTGRGGGRTLQVVLTTRGGFTRAATPVGSDVEFFIEALASTAASQELEFFDFSSNRFVLMQVVSLTGGQERRSARVFADGASRFINPTTRELQARVTWTALGAGAWTVMIDAAGWRITRP
jgi:hypothetical protein